jgi:hypothetical protein
LKQGDEAIQQEMSSYRAHAEAVAANVETAREFQRTEEQVKVIGNRPTASLPVL